jgi:hypothetical protein
LGEPILQSYYTSINSYLRMRFSARAWWWILTGSLPITKAASGLIPIGATTCIPDTRLWRSRRKILRRCRQRALAGSQEILNAAMYYAGLLFATMGASAGSEGLLTQAYNRLAKHEGDPEANVLLMGWNNIPVRSEKSLYDIAMWGREDEELAAYILNTSAHDLVGNLDALASPAIPRLAEFASRFRAHLDQFGHLVFQMDFAEPLPREHPEMLLETIKMYLRGQGTIRTSANGPARDDQTAETIPPSPEGLKGIRQALNWDRPWRKCAKMRWPKSDWAAILRDITRAGTASSGRRHPAGR